MVHESLNFDIEEFPVGEAVIKDMLVPSFYGMAKVTTPVYIYRATKKVSPCVVVTSCVHGDEINGLRISQTLMKSKLKLLKGTLIVIPIVNIYGFLNKVRYLPDRKDLNRSFPGRENGSFGMRFAKLLMDRFATIGDIFIDLHSGGLGRFNAPQIRVDYRAQNIKRFLNNLEIPLVVNSFLREGSFREALARQNKRCIVFEGGEGLRVDANVTAYGFNMIKSILVGQKMLSEKTKFKKVKQKYFIHKTKWFRAESGGIFINMTKAGQVVKKDQIIGEIRKNTGDLITTIRPEADAIILGASCAALIMAGDALFNMGYLGENLPFEEELYNFDHI